MVPTRSIHVIANLIEILMPGYGFILEVHPTQNRPGIPVMISNMQEGDIVGVLQEYIDKHRGGEIHVNNSKPLKN